jgi:hypothetical protein
MYFSRVGFGAATVLAAVLAFSCSSERLRAHGFEGDRFFPPTISTDDPFATDEFSIGVSTFNNPAASDGSTPRTREVDVSAEFDKEIFPKFALGVSGTYQNFDPQDASLESASDGFANMTLSAKYQLFENAEHEFIFSLGGEVDLGDTGDSEVGVDSFSTYTPTLYYGKGFGDLPDALKYLKPLALTGTVGWSIPGHDMNADGSFNSQTLNWGFALEYSLPYLQQHVEDVGLPHPLSDMIPLVEFNMSTPLNHNGGPTTGTIDPGVLWETQNVQFGVEAEIPVNQTTGPNVGAVVSVQIFIDDLFPKIFGHPLFFNHEDDNASDNEASEPNSGK